MINPGAVMSQMMQQQMLGRANGNPLFQRAQEMAKGKSPEELEQVARNLCQQRGIDINAAFQQFQQVMGAGMMR